MSCRVHPVSSDWLFFFRYFCNGDLIAFILGSSDRFMPVSALLTVSTNSLDSLNNLHSLYKFYIGSIFEHFFIGIPHPPKKRRRKKEVPLAHFASSFCVTFPRNAMVGGDNSLRADFPLRHHRLFFCNARGIISGPLGAFVLFAVSEQSNRSLHIIACVLRMNYSLEWA